jgi:subtilase family serine protease
VKKNLKGGQNVGALAPGESASPVAAITVYSDTVPGTYTLQACADGPKAVSEQNESNNCANATGTITIQQTPNLVVSSVGNPPSIASLGGKFNFTNGVRNTGNVVAAASSTKYYLVSTVDGTRMDL